MFSSFDKRRGLCNSPPRCRDAHSRELLVQTRSGLCNQSAQTPTRCARGTPSLLVNGYKEIGLFVAAISSLYLRLPYNKHLVLVKNLLTSITVILPLRRLRFGD